MKHILLSVLLIGFVGVLNSCTPNRGCTEATADNFDVSAEEDDGTCIPSRDKLIGNFTYSKFWIDVVSASEFSDIGTLQITEANTANNAYNLNFDGNLFLQGTVSQNNLLLENHVELTYSYSGNGTWLPTDTVDAILNVTYLSQLLPAPQVYTYYCSKVE